MKKNCRFPFIKKMRKTVRKVFFFHAKKIGYATKRLVLQESTSFKWMKLGSFFY